MKDLISMIPRIKGKTSNANSLYLVFLLLLSGDIELNPGPGDPRDILRAKSDILTEAFSKNLDKVVVKLNAKKLIPQQAVEEAPIVEAATLVGVLQSQLSCSSDSQRYFIDVCNVLRDKDLGDETLATLADNILEELGSTQQDSHKLKQIIVQVMRTNYATFNKSLKENIKQISQEMYARGLISKSVMEYPTYDSLIREFEAGLNFKKSVKAIEEHCSKFIESIMTQKGPPKSHAREIAEQWREEVLKSLHFHFNVHLDIKVPKDSGALKEWMKKGSVDLTVTRVNMLGVPGSGKTCAQRLLLDEGAPKKKVNDSTAIACPTVRAVRVAVDDDSKKWKRITREKLLEGLAADLNKASQEKIEESGRAWCPLIMRFGRFLFRTRATSSEDTNQSPVSSDSKNSVSSKQIEDDVFYAEEVVQEILKTDLTDIRLKGHWLYIIDSGGQPAYQELLPLFTRAASLNIITLDLSKSFNDKLVMMYRANGKYFPCRSKSSQLASFESAVSTAANFKSLDISRITEPHHHSMHLILGTHYDEVKKADLENCEYDLKSSISSLQPYLNDCIIRRSENSIIFPVNTVAKSKKKRAEYRKEVCEAIWMSGSDASITIKIPIQWFAFELSLPEKKSIISIKEAEFIGKKFGMKEEDTKEALQYFHDVSLMLYYPEVINNIVFLDPKPILDILSQLLALTFVDDEHTCNDKKALKNSALLKSILVEQKQVSRAIRNNLRDGFFYGEIFTILKSKEVFSQSDFKLPDDLISLLLHLNIITKVERNRKGRYFIPYALPSYQGSKTPAINKTDPRSLLIVWIDENKCLPVPQGLFPLVVMHLLNQKELKIDLPSSTRPASYFKFQDAMSIKITFEEIPRTLHLIYRYTHIEIAFTGPQEHCSKTRTVVMQAVDKVTDDLHMEHNHANAFVCPDDPEKCFCHVVDEERFIVNCTACSRPASITEDDYKFWFKCSTNATIDTSKSPKLGILGFGLVMLLVLAGCLAFYFCSIQGVAIYGLVLLFAFIGYLVFIWKSTQGVAIYGLVILAVFVVGYLVFIWKSIQGLVIYGLVLLVLPLLVLAEIFSIWGSIARITVSVVVIGIGATWIMTWINGGDVTKLEPLVNLGTTILNLL